jgi:hypothetical protein
MEITDENIQEMAGYLGGVEEPRRTEPRGLLGPKRMQTC